jgi:hypothetical protein
MLFLNQLPPGARPCAVIPGRQRDPKGFIDTGNELPGFEPHIYCSYEGVKQMALRMGFVEGQQHQEVVRDLSARLAACELELDETREQLSMADGYLDALDVLKMRGATEHKRGGRPKQKQPEKAVG